jgi:sigma-B regulation protein RsbU (phosphoserine phosphatase)
VNDALLRHQPDRFCTAVYARVRRNTDGVRVALATAGHPTPLHVPRSGPVRPVGGHGRVLGVTADCVVANATVDLAPGDALVFFTDGVTDARRDDERFGEGRLRALLEAARGEDAVTLARHVERAVLDFRGDEAQDDIAVVVVRAGPLSR